MSSSHHATPKERGRKIGRTVWLVAASALALLVFLVLVGDARPEERVPQAVSFEHMGSKIEVAYLGEVDGEELFGPGGTLLDHVQPVCGDGEPEGTIHEATPAWLQLEYRIDDYSRTVLVAKKPLMNEVSWNAVARAGAALGDGSSVRVGHRSFEQNAILTDPLGRRYRVRLMRCGQSTTAPFSEWNLLVGGVHEGDLDFRGERYGWLEPPYSDEDLKVGYEGSLNWCRELWLAGRGERVVRGYFNVSRFHATAPGFKGGRIFWRPILELVEPDAEQRPLPFEARPEVSPNRAVSYYGTVSYDTLFGDLPGIRDLVEIREDNIIEDGRPDWLRFVHEGKILLVAAKPVGHSISWDAIARAGGVSGDGSLVRVGAATYQQDLEVEDAGGHRYRVRLLRCGESTIDHRSEWNALIGGVHVGDGAFVASPDGLYGWVERPLSDEELHIGTARGTASWCQETEQRGRRRYAANRGYLTVARYHTTRSSFGGYGFSWRPVLERVQ